MIYDLIVVGGGAGGFFTAIRLAEFAKGVRICILEAAKKPLSKVEISGGGRCNVTHACFDPEKLTAYYPRGQKELLEPFQTFQPSDLFKWFKSKGIELKTESDGRVFPVSDKSSTIIDCFMREIRKANIQLDNTTRGVDFEFNPDDQLWTIKTFDGNILKSRFLLLSSGSDQRIWNKLRELGYTIISPVPSLFTFNIADEDLHALTGISKENVDVSIPSIGQSTSGPLLITHWGFSGPAVLKLSAWGARELYDCAYVLDLHVHWNGKTDPVDFANYLKDMIGENPKKYIQKLIVKEFPSRLWKYLCEKAEIGEFTSGAEFGKNQLKRLMNVLTNDVYRVIGKSTFKEEFVTAGGVDLREIDFKKFESKKHRGLFFVGEILNIDAVTGGFNFQAAWTGAHIAAKAMAKGMSHETHP